MIISFSVRRGRVSAWWGAVLTYVGSGVELDSDAPGTGGSHVSTRPLLYLRPSRHDACRDGPAPGAVCTVSGGTRVLRQSTAPRTGRCGTRQCD